MCVGALFELRAEVEFAPSSAQHSHLRLRAEAVLDAVRRCDRGPGIAGLRWWCRPNVHFSLFFQFKVSEGCQDVHRLAIFMGKMMINHWSVYTYFQTNPYDSGHFRDIVAVEGKNIWRTPKAGFGITGMKIQWAMAIVFLTIHLLNSWSSWPCSDCQMTKWFSALCNLEAFNLKSLVGTVDAA